MKSMRLSSAIGAVLVGLMIMTISARPAAAQGAGEEPDTRAEVIAARQAEKAQNLHPPEPDKAEIWLEKIQQQFTGSTVRWHPFFQNAYAGGGFALGAGYSTYVSPYNRVDFRGSYSVRGYKRIEAEFVAPRLFDRRGRLSLLGGWREATQVGFYGIGTANTSKDDRVNYGFSQPYASALLEFWPTRNLVVVSGGAELSTWDQGSGSGNQPSIEEVYDPAGLPGLGTSPTYVHTLAGVGLDSRTSPGYTRRGGFYGVTVHDYNDQDGGYDFRQVDYDAVQHVPLGRDAWVLSLRGAVSTTYVNEDNQVPFFMLPALGGGSSLRGFSSWRFRDRHSLLLSAEWRILVNQFFETAVFADAGKVVADRGDLDFDGLKSDYGFGIRFHGPLSTPLRIDFARSNEGLAIVFSSSAAF